MSYWSLCIITSLNRFSLTRSGNVVKIVLVLLVFYFIGFKLTHTGSYFPFYTYRYCQPAKKHFSILFFALLVIKMVHFFLGCTWGMEEVFSIVHQLWRKELSLTVVRQCCFHLVGGFFVTLLLTCCSSLSRIW